VYLRKVDKLRNIGTNRLFFFLDLFHGDKLLNFEATGEVFSAMVTHYGVLTTRSPCVTGILNQATKPLPLAHSKALRGRGVSHVTTRAGRVGRGF